MKGLDGIQGPMYVGTGCVFRRQALYGHEPPKAAKRPRMGTCGYCPCFRRQKQYQKNSKANVIREAANLEGLKNITGLIISRLLAI